MIEAEQIIARFGGIRPMAAKLGVPVTTVQGWKERGVIPKKRVGEIRAAAAAHGIALADTDMRPARGFGGAGEPAEATDVEFDEEPVGEGAAESDFDQSGAGEDEGEGESTSAFEAWERAEISEPSAADEQADAHADAQEEFQQRAPRVTIVPGSRPKRLYAALIGVAVGFVLAVVAVGGWWVGGGGAPAPSGSLQARLAAAEKRVAELEESRDTAAMAAERVAKLASEFENLRQTLAGLDEKLASLPGLTSQAGAEASAAMEGVREQAQALVARLDGIEERLATLADGAAGDAGAAVRALKQETDAALAALRQQLDAALSRLATFESAGAGRQPGDRRGAVLVLSVGQLREAVRAGGAFEAELTAVRALAGTGAQWVGPLDTLAAYAKDGVSDARTLRRDFGDAAKAVVLSTDGEAPRDWLERALAEAKSLVTVRRVGDIEGDEPDAVVARAELVLKQGDVGAAEAALAALEGAPAAAMAPWRARARAHVSVGRALAAIDALALARLAEKSK